VLDFAFLVNNGLLQVLTFLTIENTALLLTPPPCLAKFDNCKPITEMLNQGKGISIEQRNLDQSICPADSFHPAQVLLNTMLEPALCNTVTETKEVLLAVDYNFTALLCKTAFPFCKSITLEAST